MMNMFDDFKNELLIDEGQNQFELDISKEL